MRKTDLDREPTRTGLTREAASELAHDHCLEEARAEPGSLAGRTSLGCVRRLRGQLLPSEPNLVA